MAVVACGWRRSEEGRQRQGVRQADRQTDRAFPWQAVGRHGCAAEEGRKHGMSCGMVAEKEEEEKRRGRKEEGCPSQMSLISISQKRHLCAAPERRTSSILLDPHFLMPMKRQAKQHGMKAVGVRGDSGRRGQVRKHCMREWGVGLVGFPSFPFLPPGSG